MASKRIIIEPDTLVRILNSARDAQGKPLIPVAIKKSFKTTKAWYDANSGAFGMDVESDSFNEQPGGERLPQAFNVQIKTK